MSSRVNKPDTPADSAVRDCLLHRPPISFIMTAGAGSGKTTSLVKALSLILSERGGDLRAQGQQVACITYTEVAAAEIWKDVGENPLIRVSTIHSFLWQLVHSFQRDIKEWVGQRIEILIDKLSAEAAGFTKRTRQTTRDANKREILRYEGLRRDYQKVTRFTYGSGSDFRTGVLGHSDVIRMAPCLIQASPLLRTLFAQKYPFVFVDESQDTMPDVVFALTAIAVQESQTFCLGFFGDPMQQIYQTGIGKIPREASWTEIQKLENYRCATNVLAVANAIRVPADGLEQTGGRTRQKGAERVSVPGTAFLFVLPADEKRDRRLNEVRAWMAARTHDEGWQADGAASDVKVLVLVHRMAAQRLGFAELYSACNDKAPSSFADNFLDASLWPARPFMQVVLPLVAAHREGRDFDLIHVLRATCPLFSKERLSGADVADLLTHCAQHVETLAALMADASSATTRDVLLLLRGSELAVLDERLLGYLDAKVPAAIDDEAADEGGAAEQRAREAASMAAFLAVPAAQFWAYDQYIREQSPFSTQQGIKGAEFQRVLTVLDDEEGRYFLFSYNKLFGITPPSETDLDHQRMGEDSQIERTQRLFYVTCTRAEKDLAVVLFTSDVTAALPAVRAKQFFPPEAVLTEADLVVVQQSA